jgi:phosphoserine phosphatase RsbU/P
MGSSPSRLRCACDVFALTLMLLAPAALDHAQAIVAHGAAGPARLDGPWLLFEGDPPGGPLASVDPRPGRTYWLSKDRRASAQGPNVVWLRATVSSDQFIANPALLVNPDADDCTVFVNGQRAADCAGWPRTTIEARRWMLLYLQVGPAQVALRIVGLHRQAARLPRSGDVLLGEALVLEDIRTAADAAHLYDALLQALLCLGELLGGVILLLAFRNDRGAREYLWFAAFLFLDGTMSLESVFNGVYPLLPRSTVELTDSLGMIGRYAPLVGFIAAFTGVRLNRWMRGYQILLLVVPVLIGLPYLSEQFTWFPPLPGQAFSWILLLIQMPFIAGSLGFLAWKWRRGSREAGLLLPSFLLASAIEVLGLTVPWFTQFRVGRFAFEYDDLSMFFFLVSIGPVLLFRHRRISLEQVRVSAEFEAAREVQQRLVTTPPTVPGFQIEGVYLPATQVGGDFYRILPEEEGGILVVVGDVSGKGLPAAMTVSAIIGSLRTLSTAAPAEILRILNLSLAGDLRGGFVTCLAARLHPDGSCTLANAGHVAPYINGVELAIDNGLPLGLSAESVYPEMTFTLPPGAQLTVITDGVVEARNTQGELFGFERTAAISTESAESIARAASTFGQEDDITVLTLELVATGVAHA